MSKKREKVVQSAKKWQEKGLSAADGQVVTSALGVIETLSTERAKLKALLETNSEAIKKAESQLRSALKSSKKTVKAQPPAAKTKPAAPKAKSATAKTVKAEKTAAKSPDSKPDAKSK